MNNDYVALLQRRLTLRPTSWLDVHSQLKHFALITYALPKERLARYIPRDRYEIPDFEINGQRLALMSAVPFVDADFHFPRLFPYLKFGFGQTNFRAYVIDKKTNEHCVWFFGTTLGSAIVHVARTLWNIPWHQARYRINCDYDADHQRYRAYQYEIHSSWCNAQIDLEDTGEPLTSLPGFNSFDEMQLILTHPVDGYFYRLDGRLGAYSVWHAPIEMTLGRARQVYFSLYEQLGLLSRKEMQNPHSVLLSPLTEFRIYLPPKLVTK